ncbi:MAG: prepilin-type N-terminal cleavage/methylation domain-containing protein [Candidatus Binatia bacterium]|nr:prepilin-type N-terminal cleavage/methylation domain-containing protein [Candidatus Binatia bacterium]
MQRREVTIQSMKLQDQRGFTLVELMVAAGLSVFVLATMYGVFRSQIHTVKGQESRMEAQEYAMSVLDLLVREIRNTGYFPTTPCDNTGGIAAATATSFSFVYDRNNDGACSGDDEVVVFAYDGTNVTRNGQALTDGNAAAFQFAYYPQQTSATAPDPYCFSLGIPAGCSGDLAANLMSVQKIMISVTMRSMSPDVEFGGQSTITMSSAADLRNHGVPS